MITETVFMDQRTRVRRRTLSIVQRWGWMLFSAFVIAVLVEPAYIAEAQGGIVHLVFYISRYIAAVSVVFLYFVCHRKLDGFLLGCVVFEMVLFLSTLFNSASVEDWLHDSAFVIAFAMFLQIMVDIDGELLLRALSMVLGFYVNVNTLTKLLYPDGLYKNSMGFKNCWFLGYDNVACVIILTAICISLFRILLYRRKWMIWDWSVVIGGVWFTFSLNVATAIIAMAGFFLLMMFTRFERIRAIIGKAWLIIVGMIGLFLLIQFFVTQENGLFSLIFLLLQKSSSFSGRAPLWRAAWSELNRMRIIFGLGIHGTSEYIAHFGRYWSAHLHCYYLQVIYEGGLVAFGALLGWLFHVARRFDQTEHRYCTMIFLAGLLAIMLMWQTEASNNLVRYFVIVLFLLYNAKKFETLEQRVRPRRWRMVFSTFK